MDGSHRYPEWERQTVTANEDDVGSQPPVSMEEVLRKDNLIRALKRVRANKGAPGVDGMPVDELEAYLHEHWLVSSTGKSVGLIAKELDLTETALRAWVKRAEEQGATKPSSGALDDAERGELTELRRRVKRLEMEREILKKAAAFFAQESK